MSGRGAALLLVIAGLGCGDPEVLPCEELEGAASLPRVPLTVGTQEISAEVARTEEDRETIWAGRRCELDAALWVPDVVGPASVTLCEVEFAVDLVFLREGAVVYVDRNRAPCRAPCNSCPVYGEGAPDVDAVLWLLADQVDVSVGDSVGGLQDVPLPTG